MRTLKIFGKGESEVAQMLDGLGEGHADGVDLTLQYRATFPEIHVRLVLSSDSGDSGHEALDRIAEEASDRLGKYLFATGDGALETSFADRVVSDLRRAGLSVAVADGCTAGEVTRLFLGSAESTLAFRGSVVARSAADWKRLLDVEPEEVAEGGTPNPVHTLALAEAIRRRCEAELGLAVVGNPAVGGTLDGGRLVVAVAAPAGSSVRDFHFPLEADRFGILAAYIALTMLRKALREG